ncbi:YndM family protein [Paenisporosarcina antarctica]|uniref:YndM family protein n=1 Tax=Paenisporosarcina antarctica TaxID=417367 RepID=UPI001FB991A7|nr:YndM family protein [Paenisporosarcina antarctica]
MVKINDDLKIKKGVEDQLFTKALLIKFIMITAVLWIVLGWFYGISFTNILITSVFLTGFAYVLDVYILPRIGNVFALISDLVVAWAVIWIVGSIFYPLANLGTISLIAAIIITVGEMFFHPYMERKFDDEHEPSREENKRQYKGNLQTEFAEDMDIKTAAQAKEKDVNMIKSEKRNENDPSREKRQYKGNLQTEFAEDMDIKTAAQAKEKDVNMIKSEKRNKNDPSREERQYKGNLQTEFAEDMDIKTAAQAKQKDVNIIKSKKRKVNRSRRK